MEHPTFLCCCCLRIDWLTGASRRSGSADTRADVPGGRVRRVVQQNTRTIQTVKGGNPMAKKAAKATKKKAAKKR